ncbi:MAG: WD40/YVTN/BNR-like repeat-containing protein [Terriglobales bacterium]
MRLSTFIFLSTSLFAQTSTIQNSHTTENLRGLSTPAPNIAWASGTHGTYLRTTDAGNTWLPAQVPGAESLDFRDVEAFHSDLAYLLAAGPGDQSRIYKTTDAGKTWSLQFTNQDPKGFFDCMAFWNPDHGIAVGDPVNNKFELISTEDGGQHWTPISPDKLPPAIAGEGAFAASGTCITVQGKNNVWFASGGKAARVFHSTDAGKSWSVTETPVVHGVDSAGIFSIAFRDSKHGVIAGGDYQHPEKDGPNLAFTNDAGRTWTLAPISPQWYFSAVATNRVGTAALGCPAERSSAVLVAGATHAACADTTATKWQKIWDLNLNAVSLSPSGEVFAVGPKGLIVRFAPDH